MVVKSLAAAALVGLALGRLNASVFADNIDGEAPPPPPAPAVAQAPAPAAAAKPTITIQAVPVVPPAAPQPADGASSPDRIHLVIHLANDAPPPPSQAATPSPQTPQAQPVMAPQAQPAAAPIVTAPPHYRYPTGIERAVGHLGDRLSRWGHVKVTYPLGPPVVQQVAYQTAAPVLLAPQPQAQPVYQAPAAPAKAAPAMASPQAPAKSGFRLFR